MDMLYILDLYPSVDNQFFLCVGYDLLKYM
jgi:hypothetical protein